MIQNKAIIAKLERELVKLNSSLQTHKEFVELVNSYLETILSTTDIIEEDMIYNKIVLNFRAGDNAVSVIKLNPPYNSMVDLTKISTGWGKGNSIEPRSDITIMHNVLVSYECIYENYENILSILGKKKLDSREKPDFLL